MYAQIFFVTSRARRSLHTADFRQRVAELLRSENAHALLLHGRGHFLAVRLRSRLAKGLLRRLERRLRRLRDGRLLRRRGRDRRLLRSRRGRHSDRGLLVHTGLEP